MTRKCDRRICGAERLLFDDCPKNRSFRGHPASTPKESDSHWRDPILFCEYFHGDNAAGLGASHQTDRLVAKLIQLHGFLDPDQAPGIGQEGCVRAGFWKSSKSR